MGKQSSLGPIDPQIFGMPAQAILEEFHLAVENIKKDPASTPLWQQIVSRYHPSFLIECVQAIEWSKTMVHEWLCQNMLGSDATKDAAAQKIVDYLSDHARTATHARHLPVAKCEEIGLKIQKLEDDKKLQDLVLTVHHSYMHTFSMSSAIKITENHLGVATVLMGVTPNRPAKPAQTPAGEVPISVKPADPPSVAA